MLDNTLKDQIKDRLHLPTLVQREGIKLTGGPNDFKGLCPFHPDKDPSLTVFNKGEGWGYKCFACDAKGDVFTWLMERNHVDFPRALRMAAAEVGIPVPEPRVWQPKEVQAAAEKPRGPVTGTYDKLIPETPVFTYLTEKRGLNVDWLRKYSVGQCDWDGEPAYAFAYRWTVRGKPRFEFCKRVKLRRDDQGKKIENRDPVGGKNILFGMNAVPDEAKELVICEGEIDAVTWAQYGFPAVSVPGGAGYLGWIQLCYEWLSRFTKIHISFDEDRAGRLKVAEVVKRLGMERADIVRLPEKTPGARYKDANECLQAGVAPEAMAESVRQAEFLTPEKLKSIYDFEAEIWEKFHPEGGTEPGLVLPWGNRYGSSLPFRFRYGEVTVWSGYNKHGKSEVLNHVVVDLCWQGDRALICSLEIRAPETYRKLIRMTMGRRDVCAKEDRDKFRDRCLRPLADKIWVYDHVGNAPVDDVLNVMQYAYRRFGCRQFVLDSLMKFEGLDGDGQEIWLNQRNFMNKLCEFAALYDVHIHLVAHSKKPDKGGESVIPRKYNIMGSAYISNLAFNVIVVWRNRKKQDELEKFFQRLEDCWAKDQPSGSPEKMPQFKRLLSGLPPKDAAPELREYARKLCDYVTLYLGSDADEMGKLLLEPDSYFIVDAQRGGDGSNPARHLWFHFDSLQFVEEPPTDGKAGKGKHPVVYADRAVKGEPEPSGELELSGGNAETEMDIPI